MRAESVGILACWLLFVFLMWELVLLNNWILNSLKQVVVMGRPAS
jgi:hypothetical protein